MTSKNEICSMALGRLGSYKTINDIDKPTSKEENVFNIWYDPTRREAIKIMHPNFAIARDVVALSTETTSFGYEHAYLYPSDCLKVLGIGPISDKQNNFAVENGKILTNEAYPDGLPLRYLKDVTDTTLFSADFIMFLSWLLAGNVCQSVTQDVEKIKLIESILPTKIALYGAMQSQENTPVTICHSRWSAAKTANPTGAKRY